MMEATDRAELVVGVEKSLALDAASLLGGNEYMVGQLLQSQNKKSFSPEDQIVINWALEVLWGQKVYDEFSKTNQVVDGQKVFTSLFHPNVQVARLMSTCMLYSVRYEDTKLWTNPANNSYRALVVNAKNLPNISLPLAQIGPSKKIPCDKLAMIYQKQLENQPRTNREPQDKTHGLTRKLSTSLMLERSLLNQIRMIAVVPAP